jgi:glycosyltransferase involved in cell wall biosynthesis
VSKPKQLHFLLIYPLNTAPSQRFRFEQFFPLLDKSGIVYTVDCFYDENTFSKLYANGNKLVLLFRLLLCFSRRCFHLFRLQQYDCVFIQRGAAPFGPPIFEWVIGKVFQKPIIYDFDDAIWRQPDAQSSLKRLIKSTNKVSTICRWAHTVVVGNDYLAAYAQRYNTNVVVIPTVVDTETRFVPAAQNNPKQITIGWTGSHTTLPYLESLEPVLAELQKQYAFSFLVMANKPPVLPMLQYYFVPWSEEAEVRELQKIDIGIMPLPDDEWTKGKCGFKAIQYMALQKPAVASAVGVNAAIIDHGVNGFLCRTTEDWKLSLGQLLRNPSLITEQGKAARKKIEACFSLKKATAEWCKVIAQI